MKYMIIISISCISAWMAYLSMVSMTRSAKPFKLTRPLQSSLRACTLKAVATLCTASDNLRVEEVSFVLKLLVDSDYLCGENAH